jgi:hypothetical protein
MPGDGTTIFAHAYKLGFEGIVSKVGTPAIGRAPTKTWLKIRNPMAPGRAAL